MSKDQSLDQFVKEQRFSLVVPLQRHLMPLLSLLLVLATFALYWRSLNYPPQFDDLAVFNPDTLKAYSELSLFDFSRRWFTMFLWGKIYAAVGYAPGMVGNLFWYRFLGVAFHAATAVALFFFVFRLISRVSAPEQKNQTIAWSFVTGLIFAWHPAAVYGVAYTAQATIVMATFFGLLMLHGYLTWLERNSKAALAGAVLCYFLAVFSKEHSVMLPGVAFALGVMVYGRSWDALKKQLLPMLPFALITVMVFLQLKGYVGRTYEDYGMAYLERIEKKQYAVNVKEMAYSLSVVTQGYIFFKYLVLWLIPNPAWMSIDLRQDFATSLFSWPETAGFALFAAYPLLALWLLLSGGRRAVAGFVMSIPWILFATEISTVRVQEPLVIYRSYLWMIGPLMLLPVMVSGRKPSATRKLGLGLLLCAVLFPLAVNRVQTFSLGSALWADVVEKNRGHESRPGVSRGVHNLGSVLFEEGRYVEAVAEFDKAYAIDPATVSLIAKSDALMRLGKVQETLDALEMVLKRDPGNVDAYLNQSAKFQEAGKLDLALQAADNVIVRLTRISLEKEYMRIKLANARTNRANILRKLGRMEDAWSELNQAIRIDPKSANAYNNRAFWYLSANEVERALVDVNWAISLNPALYQAYVTRSSAYIKQRKWEAALADINLVLQAAPDYPGRVELFNNKGLLHMQLGQRNAALISFTTGCLAGDQRQCQFVSKLKQLR